MRSKRDLMKSPAARFSSVSVSRPRSESPARKNRSARRSDCRMESFCGARVCASRAAASAITIDTSISFLGMAGVISTDGHPPQTKQKNQKPQNKKGQHKRHKETQKTRKNTQAATAR